MPVPYPQEFRDDVVRVARNREKGVTLAQIAKGSGVHEMTLSKRLRQAAVEDGEEPGATRSESAENRELKQRIRLLEQENEVLRRAAAYLSQANLPKRLYPLVRELAADTIPVAVACRVLGLARRHYYRWLRRSVTEAEITEAHRANALFDAHRDDPEFGYRFLAREAEMAGERMSERTAWRICRDNAWWSAVGKKRSKHGRRSGPPVHGDLVRREVTAGAAPTATAASSLVSPLAISRQNSLSTSLRVEGRPGDFMGDRPVSSVIQPAGRPTTHSSDQGCCNDWLNPGSRSRKFMHALNRHDLVGSMGGVGAAGDNAAMESFFALLQNNVLDRRTWATREALRTAIVTWIERTYHRRRRQLRLGRLTPIEYETTMKPAAALAA
ncbi:IS3 family transposase [Streptomyces sp. NPDC058442]|uniref:IS3 family transposase n=1 Tax=Streptomyces sp. NPDC058442 TaxID=3346503 RepID=UPI003648C0F8